MTITELMVILQSPNWDTISANERTLKEWLIIARTIRSGGMSISKPFSMLVARIQIICVDAGLIDDETFVRQIQT